MLRSADKRLFISERLTEVFGGRNVRSIPVNRKPARPLRSIPPVGGYANWWSAIETDSLIASTGRLKCWLDLEGTDHLWAYGAVGGLGLGPAYGSRTLNGITVPDFQGNVVYSMASLSPRDDRSSSTFVVIEPDTVAAGIRQVIGSDGTGGLQIRISANDLQTATSATLMAEQLNTISASTAIVVGHVVTATDITHYSNTTSETDANATAITANRRMELGQDQVNGQAFDGAIAEIVYYPDTLSSGDATAVINWLKARWGIA